MNIEKSLKKIVEGRDLRKKRYEFIWYLITIIIIFVLGFSIGYVILQDIDFSITSNVVSENFSKISRNNEISEIIVKDNIRVGSGGFIPIKN